jgi:tetratricopeptide (TPR) repeat protein
MRLEQAVAAFQAALEERTRSRTPLQWAGTQNNLGLVLQALGARETGTERLEQAVASYHAALEERTRGRMPMEWAFTQGNLGNAEIAFYDKTSNPMHLDLAEAHVRSAKMVFAEAGADQYAEMADEQLANIAMRRN